MEQKIAVLGLVAAALIWAVTAISYKILLSLGLSFILILWVVVVFRFIAVWFISDYKKVKHEWVRDIGELKLLLLNALFALGTPVFFVLALDSLNVSDVNFLVFTVPAWVLVFAVFFLGEKLNPKKVLGFFLTLAGVYLIASPSGMLDINQGFIFAILASFTFAGDIITGRELKDYSYHTVSIYSNGFQIIVLTILTLLFFGIPSFEHSFIFLGILALLGLFRGVASDLYYYALEKLEASTASVISLSELIFVGVLAFILLNEIPTGIEIIGFSLILLSGLILTLRKSDVEYFEYLIHLRRKH